MIIHSTCVRVCVYYWLVSLVYSFLGNSSINVKYYNYKLNNICFILNMRTSLYLLWDILLLIIQFNWLS